MNALLSLGILASIALRCLIVMAALAGCIILMLLILQKAYLVFAHHRDMQPKFRTYRMEAKL